MNFKGTIIEESLADKSILDGIKIHSQEIEEVTPRHNTPWVKQWTLDTIEIADEDADMVAENLSRAFDTTHTGWYIDFKNDVFHFIIFPNKVFKVVITAPNMYKTVRDYGQTLGIPFYQMEFEKLER